MPRLIRIIMTATVLSVDRLLSCRVHNVKLARSCVMPPRPNLVAKNGRIQTSTKKTGVVPATSRWESPWG